MAKIDKEEIKNKLDEVGHKIDDKVEEVSAEKGIPKWAVWLGLAVVVGIALNAFGII